jgi:hypothetical protein
MNAVSASSIITQANAAQEAVILYNISSTCN